MKIRVTTLVSGLAAAALLSYAGLAGPRSAPPVAPATAAEAASFTIDGGHSSVVFRVKHAGVAYFWGTFDAISGAVQYDSADPTKSSIEISIPAESVYSRNEKRDAHIKSPDFLNAAEFPELTFKSTGVRATGDDRMSVSGNLTLRGVTKPITISVEKTGEGDTNFGDYRVGFEGKFLIEAEQFDLAYRKKMGPDQIAHEIEIIVSLECVLR